MNCEGCEEGAYVIDKLAKLLAEIAIIVNGPEPPLTRWSYHDLPEKVSALKQAQPPAAAVPAGGMTVKEAWWAGARAALGIEDDTPRAEVAAAFIRAAEREAADIEAIRFARRAAGLLHGFMLDTNAIGAREAGVNLARSIKEALKADAAIKAMQGETK